MTATDSNIFDDLNRLSSMTADGFTTNYEYDDLGRIVSVDGLRRFYWLLFVLSGIALHADSAVFAQSTKGKSKDAPKPKFNVLANEEWGKYQVSLAGDGGPLGKEKVVTLSLTGGKVLADVAISDVVLGPADGLFQSVTVVEGDGKKKQPKKYSAGLVTHVKSEDREFDVVYDPAKKGHALIDVTSRDKDVGERLTGQQKRLWVDQSDEDREKKIAEYKKHLAEIQASYSFPTTVHETKYFLFLTDLPASQVPQYVGPLDSMYGKLCEMFLIPRTKNIFLGKCLILAFTTEESFMAYETKFLNNPGAKGNHGLCHYGGDGKVTIACFQGKSDSATFAALIVHETAHGVISRVRSNAGFPAWLSEGMADWITHTVVQRKSAAERQKKSIERIQKSGSCGGNFLEQQTSLDWWQYDVASHFVNFMIQQDPGRFRAFFQSVKDGIPPDDAVKQCYDTTFPELLTQYGRSIGVANLKP